MEELRILEKIENHLLNRKEVKIIVESDSSLKASEAEKLIAEKLSAHADQIKIKKISGKFGSKQFVITANIYNSKEDKENTEKKKKEKKGQAAEAKPEEKK